MSAPPDGTARADDGIDDHGPPIYAGTILLYLSMCSKLDRKEVAGDRS
jgi:hypothetical protein